MMWVTLLGQGAAAVRVCLGGLRGLREDGWGTIFVSGCFILTCTLS